MSKFGLTEISFTDPADIRVVQENFELIDEKATITTTGTVTLPYTDWEDETETTGYYYKDVAVSDMTADDTIILSRVLENTDSAADQLIQNAWNMVADAETMANAIRFYARQVPSVNIPLFWKMGR